ncbi:hypothetical protein CA85_22040 [Allorhodopirellula solitaria]|uniref:Uncharacterized protein n=1 Tax=Allorhodopirellula solitaria TaxID=2527987 RepID=A0A5C5XWQ0_9BACT|nr:hypothetical protein CA85_22040 [Allorhodopirellula solitaria]
MFVPADVPSLVQTVHGLEYRVSRTPQQAPSKTTKGVSKSRSTAGKKKPLKSRGGSQCG